MTKKVYVPTDVELDEVSGLRFYAHPGARHLDKVLDAARLLPETLKLLDGARDCCAYFEHALLSQKNKWGKGDREFRARRASLMKERLEAFMGSVNDAKEEPGP